jgi:uncharacterized protein (DUF1778 family)
MEKPTNIRITVTEEEYQSIRIAAAYAGTSIRKYVKLAALKEVRRQERDQSKQTEGNNDRTNIR